MRIQISTGRANDDRPNPADGFGIHAARMSGFSTIRIGGSVGGVGPALHQGMVNMAGVHERRGASGASSNPETLPLCSLPGVDKSESVPSGPPQRAVQRRNDMPAQIGRSIAHAEFHLMRWPVFTGFGRAVG